MAIERLGLRSIELVGPIGPKRPIGPIGPIGQLVVMVGQLGWLGFLQLERPIFQLVDEQLVFQRLDIQLFLGLCLVGHNQHIYQCKHMGYVQSNIQLVNIQFISSREEYIQFC